MSANDPNAIQALAPDVTSLSELAKLVDYSLMDTLNVDPDATVDGNDHSPRQVFSGHYVPVNPTPIKDPEYVAHSNSFFHELGIKDSVATDEDFVRVFSGDSSQIPGPMRKVGWATGYALSIFGTEYTQQCPFRTGNAYGDGRAVSVFEGIIRGKRWEMQLKGGGRTPYCRGADGRAVLRSSVREFLAQEHMHALGVPTSRSFSLIVSKTETVKRPWYSEGSRSMDPDRLISEPVAISTRVAPSFLRVGQLELFARRARKNEHPQAMEELRMIVLHLIDREYAGVIDPQLPIEEKVLLLATEFRRRLTALVANWIRVGYCQGNFNSDNCAAGGFTLDYGPFGFCDAYDPNFQPWTGGGNHFSFMNQPIAAETNFHMFCTALLPLISTNDEDFEKLSQIREEFPVIMQAEMEMMWAAKLGLSTFNKELFTELESLMAQTPVDYIIFFRHLSAIPDDIEPLKKSFYSDLMDADVPAQALHDRWSSWLSQWKALIGDEEQARCRADISEQMKLVNPKYSLREWFVAPAYSDASVGDYSGLRELQKVTTQPYAEQSAAVADKYNTLKPTNLFGAGGVSHYSCSS